MLKRTKSKPKSKPMLRGRQDKKGKQLEKALENFSWVELTPIKRMQKDRRGYLELKDGGYMQILEIQGKDLDSLSNAEVQRTLDNFLYWLSVFNEDVTFYTTKLPTDTGGQVAYLKQVLQAVRKEIKGCQNQRRLVQLRDREQLLRASIQTEEQIQQELYNVEFLLFLFAKTPDELDEIVRRAQTSGNRDFVPRVITRKKKIQLLKQFNNMNDKV